MVNYFAVSVSKESFVKPRGEAFSQKEKRRKVSPFFFLNCL